MAITVIYGPQCTGKTFHAAKYQEHYGCARTVDDFFEAKPKLAQPLGSGPIDVSVAI